jgi:hypothetical protein
LHEAAAQEHPLIPLALPEDDNNPLRWPVLTKNTSWRFLPNVSIDSNFRSRHLIPMLGWDICKRNKGHPDNFVAVSTSSLVCIRGWDFSCQRREDSSTERHSYSSYFAIRLKDVPHIAEVEQQQHDTAVAHGLASSWLEDREEFVYGRFIYFVHLLMQSWKQEDKHHFLGRCELYATDEENNWSGDRTISTRRFMKYRKDANSKVTTIGYVPLRGVAMAVALAPVIKGWKPEGEAGQHRPEATQHEYVVMHLLK